MGRALVRDPMLFLFDEPLSNLDAKLRVDMRTEIKKLHHRVGKTTVYVTHDQVEAMTLASRIAVMHQGERAAVRRAGGRLQPAGQHVRRRLHGLAVDELHPRPRSRPRRRAGGDASRSPTASAPRCRSHNGAAAGAPARKVVLGIRPEHLSRHNASDLRGQAGHRDDDRAGRSGGADRRRDHGGAAASATARSSAASSRTRRRRMGEKMHARRRHDARLPVRSRATQRLI